MAANKGRPKIDARPASTWGATEAAKAAWHRKHGTAIRKVATKAAETPAPESPVAGDVVLPGSHDGCQ